MLDPKAVREDPDAVRRMIQERGVHFDLDALLGADAERRRLIAETDRLRQKRNLLGLEIARRKKAGKDVAEPIDEMRQVSAGLSGLEGKRQEAERRYAGLASAVPNVIHESVPRGPDESANVEIRRWGSIPAFDFDVRDHIEIAVRKDMLDLERAAKVAGARFYYLKNDMVRLNQALVSFALDFAVEKGFAPVQPPYMINRAAMEGAVIAEDFEDVIYRVANRDLYLIGTSEHALAAMHSGEILDGGSLPLRYAGTSPCFRKEAGAHGRDQKGIFRVHQFEKVELFVFSRPEESWSEHEKMIGMAEEFYRRLAIPYRLMLLSSGDMGKVSAKTYDIEAWMAGQGAFREIVSCSNCLEYQARRLKVRFRDRTNEETTYLHTLNGTLIATSRTMVAILEDFQTSDGHVTVPKPLRRYLAKDVM